MMPVCPKSDKLLVKYARTTKVIVRAYYLIMCAIP